MCTRDWVLNRARYAAIANRIPGAVVLTIVPERAGPAVGVSISDVWKKAVVVVNANFAPCGTGVRIAAQLMTLAGDGTLTSLSGSGCRPPA